MGASLTCIGSLAAVTNVAETYSLHVSTLFVKTLSTETKIGEIIGSDATWEKMLSFGGRVAGGNAKVCSRESLT